MIDFLKVMKPALSTSLFALIFGEKTFAAVTASLWHQVDMGGVARNHLLQLSFTLTSIRPKSDLQGPIFRSKPFFWEPPVSEDFPDCCSNISLSLYLSFVTRDTLEEDSVTQVQLGSPDPPRPPPSPDKEGPRGALCPSAEATPLVMWVM